MILWLLLALWVAGYVWGFRLMLAAARRAFDNKSSILWQPNYTDRGAGPEIDGMGATFWALGLLFVPLAWPLLWLGGLAWALIVRPGNPATRPPT
jgi:hypothetical protein